MRRHLLICLLALAPLGAGCGAGASATGPGASGGGARTGSGALRGTSGPGMLPGSSRPAITVGDKNYTEQFILGELYRQALVAQGYDVTLDRSIGPSEVALPALKSGRIDVYPEYLQTWNGSIAGITRRFLSQPSALSAARRYAGTQGLRLLRPTPFVDSNAIAVTLRYARRHHLRTLEDLRRVGAELVLGGPLQFQQDPAALPSLQQVYGFAPASFMPLEVGAQYAALDQGQVQAADVSTTDGQLLSGRYVLLRDPKRVLGWGNVVPVIPAGLAQSEGPVFTATIERVDALLSTRAMRRLNAGVDLHNQTPAAVAGLFLQAHGLSVPAAP